MAASLSTFKVNSLGRSFKLVGYEDDGYLNGHLSTAAPEIDLLTMSALLLEPGNVVLDVGANIGFYSISVMDFMNGDGKVYSFEPSKKTYEVLKKNVELNKLMDNIKTYNYGLSDKSQKHDLYYNLEARAGAFISEEDSVMRKDHSAHETIITKVLDDKPLKLPSKIDLLKLDIEGHEPNFLKGAKKFIKQTKPASIIEANHWCLNAFNHTSLPDFIEQILEIYPYVYAFDTNNIINLRDDKLKFLKLNILKNQVQNLYCDFDLRRSNLTAAAYRKFLASDKFEVQNLTEQNTQLTSRVEQLQAEVSDLKAAKSYRAVSKVNKVIRRTKRRS